jgi:hypothetical protein
LADVGFAADCVAKVESCGATNYRGKSETESNRRFV